MHYFGSPFHMMTSKNGGDVPLLVFPAQEVKGTLETFGIQKNHLGSTPLWFQIPRVALMDAENCLLGILNSSSLGPDSPLPDDYGWLRVPTQPQPIPTHPNPSQPIPTHPNPSHIFPRLGTCFQLTFQIQSTKGWGHNDTHHGRELGVSPRQSERKGRIPSGLISSKFEWWVFWNNPKW